MPPPQSPHHHYSSPPTKGKAKAESKAKAEGKAKGKPKAKPKAGLAVPKKELGWSFGLGDFHFGISEWASSRKECIRKYFLVIEM